MAQAFNVQTGGNEVSALDQSGNSQFDGTVTFGTTSYIPIPPPGMVTLYTDGSALFMYDVNGKITTVSTGGGASSFANLTVSNNLLVGTSTALGDNGAGEIQIANATTAPTTNPTGGVDLYASATGAPLNIRDSSGNVRGLCKTYAIQTSTQASVGTGQTASTELTLPVEANAKYLVECWVYWTTINSATVTTSWTGPAGTTFVWNDTTTGGDVVTTLTGVSPPWLTGNKMVRLFGTLTTTNAGTLTFTFASSVAASVTTQPQSTLTLERIG